MSEIGPTGGGENTTAEQHAQQQHGDPGRLGELVDGGERGRLPREAVDERPEPQDEQTQSRSRSVQKYSSSTTFTLQA